MKPAFIAAIVLAAIINFAPRGQCEQPPANPQQHPSNESPPDANQKHSATEAATAHNETPHWYKSPEWVLVIVGFITCGVILYQSWTTMRAARATERMVEPTRKAAEAALLNAQAVINSDRPWVIIFAIKERGSFSFHAANVGRTPAEIISFSSESRCVQNFKELPAGPEYGTDYAPRIKLLVPSGPEPPDKTEFPLLSAEDFVDAASACNRNRKVIAFYFRVLYANPLTRLRPEVQSYESRTCFAFTPSDAGEILRVWGNDAYNRHT